MWLEGRFCTIAWLAYRFSSGVSQQKRALALPWGSWKKIWGRTSRLLAGSFLRPGLLAKAGWIRGITHPHYASAK
jgi:hypothetical protein